MNSLKLQLERFRDERKEKRRQLAEQRADEPAYTAAGPLERNPVYQDIRASLARARADAAAARTR
ncbi:MAG: hypothetical protein GWO21_04665, partial [Gammaproteobacteria bacterium]|nr:hypothetical protein [Gammaproteobacteria bacterium]